MKKSTWIATGVVILLALSLSGCAGQIFGSPGAPAEAPTLAQPPAAMPTFGGELTLEEHQASVPPAPTQLHVAREGNAVRLTWNAAGPVTTPHHYSDQPLYYKVIRRPEGETDPMLVGMATSTSFLDTKASAGNKYYYSVVPVHQNADGGEIDGDRSDEVFWGG